MNDPIVPMLKTILPQGFEDVCSWCHICGSPAGLCFFWWVAILLIALILLVCLIPGKKKCPYCYAKNRRRAQFCGECDQPLTLKAHQLREKEQQNEKVKTFIASPLEDAAPPQAQPAPMPAQATAQPAFVPQDQPVEQPNPAQSKTCPHCGATLPAAAMFCGSCGNRLR